MTIYDAHTHHLRKHAIVSRTPGFTPEAGFFYSTGCHPWNADEFDKAKLMESALSPQVVAIGETGLDSLRGPSLEIQEGVFRMHIETSETVRKPLIIHCVRCIDRLLAIHKEMKPAMPWIIHGYRGKKEQAVQLMNKGLYLSLGPLFNEETARIIPSDRLLIETDYSPDSIEETAAAVAAVRGLSEADILNQCATNIANIIIEDSFARR